MIDLASVLRLLEYLMRPIRPAITFVMNRLFRRNLPSVTTGGSAAKKEDIFVVKERYLKMKLEEKRTLYHCSNRYTELTSVESWYSEYEAKQASKKSKLAKEGSATSVADLLAQVISLFEGDITMLEIDAIVNAANNRCLGGGGVDGAIHRAAGDYLYRECLTLNGCLTGEAKITAGYNLPATYVIHTVGPIGEKQTLLRSCYRKSLELCKQNELRSVAFPCISTGVYGYPEESACSAALDEVLAWLVEDDNYKSMDRVIFCLFTHGAKISYNKELPRYLHRHASRLEKVWSGESLPRADSAPIYESAAEFEPFEIPVRFDQPHEESAAAADVHMETQPDAETLTLESPSEPEQPEQTHSPDADVNTQADEGQATHELPEPDVHMETQLNIEESGSEYDQTDETQCDAEAERADLNRTEETGGKTTQKAATSEAVEPTSDDTRSSSITPSTKPEDDHRNFEKTEAERPTTGESENEDTHL